MTDKYAVIGNPSLRAETARKFSSAKHSLFLNYNMKHNYD